MDVVPLAAVGRGIQLRWVSGLSDYLHTLIHKFPLENLLQ